MSIIADYFYDYLNGTSAEQFRAKQFFKDLLEAQYLAKLIRNLPLVGESLFKDEPSSQPSISSTIANQNLLIGELLSHALISTSPSSLPPCSRCRRAGRRRDSC